MKLIYINSGNSSVIEAQVLSLLEYYNSLNRLKKLVLIQGYKDDIEKAEIDKKLLKFKIKVLWFKTSYEYTFFQWLTFSSLSKVLNSVDIDSQTIIHVRGELYGALVKKYINKNKSDAKLLVDLRGIVFEEIKKYYLLNIFLKLNKVILFKRAICKIRHVSKITVVSLAFKEYLINEHGFFGANICVNPNIANKQFTFNKSARENVRKEIGFNNNELVAICSSGGVNSWQKDNLVIQSLMNLNVKVINLSTTKVDIPGVLNKIVPFDLVPSYLAAADIAILWRDENIVNEVASPSKFSEFACMGLFVIHNGTVKLASDYIVENNAGIIIKSPEMITETQMEMFSNYNRDKYSAIGRKHFGVENIALNYLNLYSEII